METHKKAIWIIILVTIIIVLFLWFFVLKKPSTTSPPVSKEEKITETSPPQVTEKKEIDTESEPDLSLLDLDIPGSDEKVRELIKPCSSKPLWLEWIKNGELIRKIVAIVDNVALGESPVNHLDFLSPEKDFQVIRRREKIYINTKSYKRYNQITDVFASLDTEYCFHLYKRLKPTLEKAFKELGYPKVTFEIRLKQAMDVILKTPIIKGNILLEKKVITYAFADSRLERLNPAQKHLIRMGPGNLVRIQKKIKEFLLQLDSDKKEESK